MKIPGWLTERQIGGCLVLILAAPTAKAATPWRDAAPAQQEQSAPYSRAQAVGADSGNGKSIGDSAQPDATPPDAPEVAQSQSTSSDGQNGSAQPSQNQRNKMAARNLSARPRPQVKRRRA